MWFFTLGAAVADASVVSPSLLVNDSARFLVSYSDLAVYPLAALMLSGVLTFFCIRILPRFGFIDIPHGRHAHAKPTPRGGGIAIAIAFFAVAMTFALRSYYSGGGGDALSQMLRFSPVALLIVTAGVVDDRYELPSLVKLLIQIVAGVMIYFLGGGFYSVFNFEIPMLFGVAMTVVWCIVIINAFNLIDGLDGLAAGLASISSLSLATWYFFSYSQPDLAVVIMIFFGCCIGFLYFNFHPAKIFMGDTGSMFIGVFFAFISTSQVSKAVSFASLIFPMLAMGVPLFDVGLAIWRRIMRKINDPDGEHGIMEGDHDHLHHRILKRTKSDRKTAFVIYLLAFGLALVAMVPIVFNTNLSTLIFLLVMVSMVAVVRLADIELLDSATCLVKGLGRPSKRSLLMLTHPLIDFVLIGLAFCICGMLNFGNSRELFNLLVFASFFAPFVTILILSGVYRTFWLRSGINRYHLLFKALTFAALLGFGLNYLLYSHGVIFEGYTERTVISGYLLFYLLVLFFISAERFAMRYLESFGLRNFYVRTRRYDMPLLRVLLVGGGLHCRLYLNSFFCRYYTGKPFEVIGIVDDDRQMLHWNVYGFDVLGTTADLETVLKDHPFEHIVITPRSMPAASHDRITAFCEKHNIGFSYFSLSEVAEPPADFFTKPKAP